ncbi:MAG: exopolysaccharide biosynthesis polyprenyl glycosylphosphotransferase [Solirubrobacteraceae bacterium]
MVAQRERIFRRSLGIADMVAAVASVYIAFDLVFGDALRPSFLLVIPLIVVGAKIQGLYDRDELLVRKDTLDELPRLTNLVSLFVLTVWFARHWIGTGDPGSKTLLVLWILLLVSMTAARMIARHVGGLIAPHERCFLIGDATVLERLEGKLLHHDHAELVGYVSTDELEISEQALSKIAERYSAHRIIVGSGHVLSEESTLELVRAAKATGLRVSLFPGVLATVGSSVVFDDLWGMTILGVPRFGLTRSSQVLKRSFDLLVGTTLLTLLSPLLLVAAAIVRFDSRGPALFRQTRVGRHGRKFRIIKFRTMVDGADQMRDELRALNETSGLFKISRDPRVTRVGRWLRSTCIDELPQLLNVVRGEMSLVGPRPLVVDEDELVTGFDRRRLILTPGMTGQWQILAAARVPLNEMVKLDYLYVANWSLWSDLKILIRTVGVVLGRRGV